MLLGVVKDRRTFQGEETVSFNVGPCFFVIYDRTAGQAVAWVNDLDQGATNLTGHGLQYFDVTRDSDLNIIKLKNKIATPRVVELICLHY